MLISTEISYVLYDRLKNWFDSQGYPLLRSSSDISYARSMISQTFLQRMNIRAYERGVAVDFIRFFGQINYYLYSQQVFICDKILFNIANLKLFEIAVVFRTDGSPSGIKPKPFFTFGCSFVYRGYELKFANDQIAFFPLVLLYAQESDQFILNFWLEKAKSAFEIACVEEQLKFGLDGGCYIKWEGNSCPLCECEGRINWVSCSCGYSVPLNTNVLLTGIPPFGGTLSSGLLPNGPGDLSDGFSSSGPPFGGLLPSGSLSGGVLSSGTLSDGLLSGGLSSGGLLLNGVLSDGPPSGDVLSGSTLSSGLLPSGSLSSGLPSGGPSFRDSQSNSILPSGVLSGGLPSSGPLIDDSLSSTLQVGVSVIDIPLFDVFSNDVPQLSDLSENSFVDQTITTFLSNSDISVWVDSCLSSLSLDLSIPCIFFEDIDDPRIHAEDIEEDFIGESVQDIVKFWKPKFINCSLHGDIRLAVRLAFVLFLATKHSCFYFPRFRIILRACKVTARIYAPKGKSKSYRMSGINGRSALNLINNFDKIVDYCLPRPWAAAKDPSCAVLRQLCQKYGISVSKKLDMMKAIHNETQNLNDPRKIGWKRAVRSMKEVVALLKFGIAGARQKFKTQEEFETFFASIDGKVKFYIFFKINI
jgi:hypothetical protein